MAVSVGSRVFCEGTEVECVDNAVLVHLLLHESAQGLPDLECGFKLGRTLLLPVLARQLARLCVRAGPGEEVVSLLEVAFLHDLANDVNLRQGEVLLGVNGRHLIDYF